MEVGLGRWCCVVSGACSGFGEKMSIYWAALKGEPAMRIVQAVVVRRR